MSEETNQEILVELQKLRRSNQLGSYIAFGALIVGVAYIAFLRQECQRASQTYNQTRTPVKPSQSRPWGDVDDAMSRLDYTQALSLAQAIVAREKNYYYGYSYLGNIYLALGDPINAEAQYSRAYDLFPDEVNEKNLAAIRKRLARERSAQSQ